MRLQGNTEPVFIWGFSKTDTPKDWKQDRGMVENGERQGCVKSKHVSKTRATGSAPMHVNRLAQRPKPLFSNFRAFP